MSNQNLDLYIKNVDIGASMWASGARAVLGGGPAIRTVTGSLDYTRITAGDQNYAIVDARGQQIRLSPTEVVLAILMSGIPALDAGSYQLTLNASGGNGVAGGTPLHLAATPSGTVNVGDTYLNAGAGGAALGLNQVSYFTIVGDTAAGPWLGVEVTGSPVTAGTYYATLVLLSAVQGSNAAQSN
jgi:hypothetical protein